MATCMHNGKLTKSGDYLICEDCGDELYVGR